MTVCVVLISYGRKRIIGRFVFLGVAGLKQKAAKHNYKNDYKSDGFLGFGIQLNTPNLTIVLYIILADNLLIQNLVSIRPK